MKKHLPTVLIIFVFLVGGAVFLYPTVSNYLYQKNSTRAITERTEKISSISPERIAEEKESVRRYNKSLSENAVVLTDPFDPDAYPITDDEYTELLAFDEVMASIEIPAIDVDLPIYHGTKEETLLKGVGHLEIPRSPWAEKAPTPFCQHTAVCPRHGFLPTLTCFMRATYFVFMFLTKR